MIFFILFIQFYDIFTGFAFAIILFFKVCFRIPRDREEKMNQKLKNGLKITRATFSIIKRKVGLLKYWY